MASLFTAPILRPSEVLDDEQKQRGAAVLVAAEAHPNSSLSELIHLAEYVYQGITPARAGDPWELFRDRPTQSEADPSAFAPYRHPEPITFDEDDGLG